MISTIDPLSLWLLMLGAVVLGVTLAGLPLLGLWWLLVEKNTRETNRELSAPGQLDAKPTLRTVAPPPPPRQPASHRGEPASRKPPWPPAPRVRPPAPGPLDGEARPGNHPPDPSATGPAPVHPAPYPLPGVGQVWVPGRAGRDRANDPDWPFGPPFPVTPDTDGGIRS